MPVFIVGSVHTVPCAILTGALVNDWIARIALDPAILGGKPIIRGTRISVELVLDRLADGWTTEEVLGAYPGLTRADVLAALACAAVVFKEHFHIAVAKLGG